MRLDDAWEPSIEPPMYLAEVWDERGRERACFSFLSVFEERCCISVKTVGSPRHKILQHHTDEHANIAVIKKLHSSGKFQWLSGKRLSEWYFLKDICEILKKLIIQISKHITVTNFVVFE